jgi:hypothetical protein
MTRSFRPSTQFMNSPTCESAPEGRYDAGEVNASEEDNFAFTCLVVLGGLGVRDSETLLWPTTSANTGMVVVEEERKESEESANHIAPAAKDLEADTSPAATRAQACARRHATSSSSIYSNPSSFSTSSSTQPDSDVGRWRRVRALRLFGSFAGYELKDSRIRIRIGVVWCRTHICGGHRSRHIGKGRVRGSGGGSGPRLVLVLPLFQHPHPDLRLRLLHPLHLCIGGC